jgi:hypothetical protein
MAERGVQSYLRIEKRLLFTTGNMNKKSNEIAMKSNDITIEIVLVS